MKIFYCYSMPLKEFLFSKNIIPIDDEPKVNPIVIKIIGNL